MRAFSPKVVRIYCFELIHPNSPHHLPQIHRLDSLSGNEFLVPAIPFPTLETGLSPSCSSVSHFGSLMEITAAV